MEKGIEKAKFNKDRRARRTRYKLRGIPTKPRLCVVKTSRHIEVQLIDDENRKTLAAETTKAKEFRGTPLGKKSKESAKVLGERLAQKAKGLGISQVVFDRGPFKYHGILAMLADAARQAGLQF